MIRRRYKQRVEINNFYPKILQIIQLFAHAFQVSSVKFRHTKIRRRLIPVFNFLTRCADIKIFVCLYVIFHVSVIKTIDQYLIHHGALCPVRRGKSRHNPKTILRTQFLCRPIMIVIQCKHAVRHLKIVIKRLICHRNCICIIIKFLTGFYFFHLVFLSVPTQKYRVNIILFRAETNRYFFPFFWFRRLPVIRCSV